jgi:predicted phage tail protein
VGAAVFEFANHSQLAHGRELEEKRKKDVDEFEKRLTTSEAAISTARNGEEAAIAKQRKAEQERDRCVSELRDSKEEVVRERRKAAESSKMNVKLAEELFKLNLEIETLKSSYELPNAPTRSAAPASENKTASSISELKGTVASYKWDADRKLFKVLGEVENMGRTKWVSAEFTLAVYDEYGVLLGVETEYADNVAAHDKSPFKCSVDCSRFTLNPVFKFALVRRY